MITGSRIVERTPEEALDRVKLVMSGGNFEILEQTESEISFRHGTCLTQSVHLFPKRGTIMLTACDGGTKLSYEIEPTGFPKYWLTLIAILFFWAFFPPILAYQALVVQPKRLMENLLRGI
jgi:hypothetical protein